MHRRVRPLAVVLAASTLTACTAPKPAADDEYQPGGEPWGNTIHAEPSPPAPDARSSIDRAIDAERLHTTGWARNDASLSIRSVVISDRRPSMPECRVEVVSDSDQPVSLDERPLQSLLAAIQVQTPSGSADLFVPDGVPIHVSWRDDGPRIVLQPRVPTVLTIVLPWRRVADDLPPGPLTLAPFPDHALRFAGLSAITVSGAACRARSREVSSN